MFISTSGRLIGILSASALLLLGTGITPAQSAQFASATAALDKDFEYIATWTETGLGKHPVRVPYQLVSNDASSTWQCFTSKDNQPKGKPQPGAAGQIVRSDTFTAEKGSIKGTLSLGFNPGDASCSGHGLILCPVFVSYQDNSINDTLNGISATLPNISSPIPPPTAEVGGQSLCFFQK